MFVVEYRTIAQHGKMHPTNFMNVGAGKAQTINEAIVYAQTTLGKNVEVLTAVFVGSL